MTDSDMDVAVIGAGPAGSSAARRLALQGCRVVLVERSRFDAPRVGESLAPSVQPLLRELGVWREFLALNPTASYGTRSFWGDAHLQVHSHLVSRWGCGWHVNRRLFDSMLAESARSAGAKLLCGTNVVGCERSAGGWTLTLRERTGEAPRECPRPLRATVLIDATGRSSALAHWMGAQRIVLDSLVGVATEFTGVPTETEGYVMIEATPDGWWYTAPVPDGRLMAMLMTDGDVCGRSSLSSRHAWHRRLETTVETRRRVAEGAPSWGPRVFSARSQRLFRRDLRSAWLAIGDAALAVDPISGSGVVRALRTARAGAEAALAALNGQVVHAIASYETDRDKECMDYLQERAMYYGIEQRWPASPFWQRRASEHPAMMEPSMSSGQQDTTAVLAGKPSF